MKICILTTSTTVHQMGGTEVHAETLAKTAAAKGHAVTLVTSAHPQGLEFEKKDGYDTFYLPGTHFSMSRKWLEDWWTRSAEKLSELSALGRLDIIWSENLIGQYYAGLPATALKKPVLSIINGPGVRGEILNRWAQVSSPAGFLNLLTRELAQVLFHMLPWFRNVANHSDYIICVSDYCEREMRREFSGCRGKIKTIYNPVNASDFRPAETVRSAARKSYGLGGDEPVLAMSGVLTRQKGMHLGIRAFGLIKASVPAAKLLVAGGGPELENLRELAADLGLGESVIFRGKIGNEGMNTFYNAADIYINPTLRHEGLPLALLEAISCGLPCVTTRVGGTESAIEEGKSGFFTKPGDPAGMAEKAVLLLKDRDLREAMGKSARRRAIEVFSPDKIIGQYLDISEQVIRGGKS